jgi:hypothetical protein
MGSNTCASFIQFTCCLVLQNILGIVGQDPSDSKIQPVTCSHLSVLLYSIEVFPIDSTKMIGNSLEVSNFNQFIYN